MRTGSSFLATLSLIEHLHRQCLEVVKIELERLSIRDLTNVQAIMLFNIGKEEVSIGELIQRRYYLGSNASYNVKRMTQSKYLIQTRSKHDGRLYYVRNSGTGLQVYHALDGLFERHADQGLIASPITEADLSSTNETLGRLHQFWNHTV